jgi:hypothetical protein
MLANAIRATYSDNVRRVEYRFLHLNNDKAPKWVRLKMGPPRPCGKTATITRENLPAFITLLTPVSR